MAGGGGGESHMSVFRHPAGSFRVKSVGQFSAGVEKPKNGDGLRNDDTHDKYPSIEPSACRVTGSTGAYIELETHPGDFIISEKMLIQQ